MVIDKPYGILFPKPKGKEEIDDDNDWAGQWKEEKFASQNLSQMHDVYNQISTDRKTEDRSNQSRDILVKKKKQSSRRNWLSLWKKGRRRLEKGNDAM